MKKRWISNLTLEERGKLMGLFVMSAEEMRSFLDSIISKIPASAAIFLKNQWIAALVEKEHIKKVKEETKRSRGLISALRQARRRANNQSRLIH
jgi:hypothetical protein